jgi:hypothetical protein
MNGIPNSVANAIVAQPLSLLRWIVAQARNRASKRRKSKPMQGPLSAADVALFQTISLRPDLRRGVALRLGSEDIERALISGERDQVLENYFGEQEYANLTLPTVRASCRAPCRDRLILLPGILDSMLAWIAANRADRTGSD